MKTKIFDKLKQAYAPLGLGDEFLQAQADALASSGFVTDENIESVVASQKAFLEMAQKSNDKRATDATKKANDANAAKSAEAERAAKAVQDALQKQIDDLQAELKSEKTKNAPSTKKDGDDDFQKKFEAANASTIAQMKEMQEMLSKMKEENEKQSASMAKLQEEKRALEVKQAAEERQARIIAKAKELKIPQYRIDEGFNIAQDADDNAIGEYLTKVAGNIKNNALPTNSHFAMEGKDVTKAEADNLAEAMV